MHNPIPAAGRLAALGSTILALGTLAAPATAQDYPSKPLRIVHGYPGSSSETNARHIAQRLTEALGQQIIVEGKPGATGTIAADFVAKSAPDGYTLLASPSSVLGSTPHLRKVPFNTLRDFVAVVPLGTFPFLLVAHPSVPAKNARELIALARARGDGRVVLNAQVHAIGFYERHGFAAEGAEFMDAGIPHRTMRLTFLS